MRRAGLCVLSLVLTVMAPPDPLGAGAQAPTPAPPPSANSCIPPVPGPDWICQDGGWLPLGHPSIRSSVDPPPPPPPPPPPNPNSCIPPVPGPDWVCQDGGWLPLGHPSIRSGEPPPPPPPTPPPPPPSPAVGGPPFSCPTSDPFAGFFAPFGVCIDGAWVPIGHSLASDYLGRPLAINYSGTYTLTILVGDCSVEVPEVVKQRVYTAHVVQSGARLNVALTGADFWPGSNSFSGVVVSANEIRFEIIGFQDPWEGDFFEVAENVAGVGTIYLSGFPIRAVTNISGTQINGAFSQNEGFLNFDGDPFCRISRFELIRQ